MRKAHKRLILGLIGLMIVGFLFSPVRAQEDSSEKLKSQRKELLQNIKNTQKILEQTQSKKKENLAYLTALKAQIRNRASLVKSMNREIEDLGSQIGERERRIGILQSDLDIMKENFSKMLRQGYRMRGSRNKLNFLFSAKSFNQFFKRNRYLKAMVDYRKNQLQAIIDVQDEERREINRLVENRTEKLMLLTQRQDEEKDLLLDQQESERLVEILKGKEDQLRKDLRKKKKEAEELDKAIKKAIEAEIKRAEEERKRLEEEERKRKEKEKRKETIVIPEVNMKLDAEFSKNIGKLPWPVGNGYISERFGKHPHPELKNITTENNGVNIAVTRGTKARAVFNGTVTAIVEVPGMKLTVLVKHGTYFTVYSNLSVVNVKRGDEIHIGDTLGEVNTNESGLTELHFEVWKGSEKQNPEIWLQKQS